MYHIYSRCHILLKAATTFIPKGAQILPTKLQVARAHSRVHTKAERVGRQQIISKAHWDDTTWGVSGTSCPHREMPNIPLHPFLAACFTPTASLCMSLQQSQQQRSCHNTSKLEVTAAPGLEALNTNLFKLPSVATVLWRRWQSYCARDAIRGERTAWRACAALAGLGFGVIWFVWGHFVLVFVCF